MGIHRSLGFEKVLFCPCLSNYFRQKKLFRLVWFHILA